MKRLLALIAVEGLVWLLLGVGIFLLSLERAHRQPTIHPYPSEPLIGRQADPSDRGHSN